MPPIYLATWVLNWTLERNCRSLYINSDDYELLLSENTSLLTPLMILIFNRENNKTTLTERFAQRAVWRGTWACHL